MNLIEMAAANKLRKTGEKKKLSIPNQVDNNYDVYEIPLEFLYYNDQNGRINTLYKKYSSTHGLISPEPGDSEYNKMMELNREEDFWQNWDEMDYWYEHRYVQVFLTGNNKGTERVIKYESLLEEFANT